MHALSTSGNVRLLIVDDEKTNQELMRRIFSRYETMVAENGREALAMLDEYEFDGVLLDIMMPEMGGLETLEHIRRRFSPVELPVVLISALAERRGVANGIRMGANDYIVKPFDVEDIQARMATQMRMKQYADERKQMVAYLQTMIDKQERLMQVASHDLKNPMNNLKMLITLLKKSFGDDAPTMNLLNMAENSLKTMMTVVQEFLDISLRSAETVRVELQPTDTYRIIVEVVNQYAVMAFNKDIRIHANEIQGIVMADPNRLSQVIGNLLSNAIKYSPRHSDIWLDTLIESGIWQLTITDQGPGVPPEERDRLFQPFSTVSTKPTAGEASTGLGLWIVREMMHLQGGEVGAHFPPEGGSQFWVQLRVVPEATGAPASNA
jgi:signal transduction histidine kinase